MEENARGDRSTAGGNPPPGEAAPQGKPTRAHVPDRTDPQNQAGHHVPQIDTQHEPESEPPITPFYKRPILMTVLVSVSVIVAIGVTIFWLYDRQFESTDDAFIDGNTVQMAPKISGYVTNLLIADNQLVNKGDVLLEIDPRDYEVALAQAKAAEAAAQGSAAQARARVDAAIAQAKADEADAVAAEATAANAQQDYERNSRLVPRGVSQQTFEASTATAKSTQAQAAAARARAESSQQQVHLAQSQLVTAKANVKQAEASVAQATLNLSYTKILAPIRGWVTHRTVELGDYVQPGQPLFALVDPNIWVTANFKETQLTHMKAGQPVEVSVDAFPGKMLRAHVDSFQRGSGAQFSALPPENATGNYVKVVQRIPVKIVFDQPPPINMILGPGMSVVPTVTVREGFWIRKAGPQATAMATGSK